MKKSTLTAAFLVPVVAAFAAPTTPAAAQETGTFTLSQNGNAIATETFTRTADRLETRMEVTGRALMISDATLGEAGTVDRVELRILPPGEPDAEPIQSLAADFDADSVRFEQPIGTAAGASAGTDGTVPYLNPSPSYMEQILRRARELDGPDVTVQIWLQTPSGPQVVPANVTFDGSAATLDFGGVSIEAETDDQGRLLGAEIASQGIVIERE